MRHEGISIAFPIANGTLEAYLPTKSKASKSYIMLAAVQFHPLFSPVRAHACCHLTHGVPHGIAFSAVS
jgi:hypothetical protein